MKVQWDVGTVPVSPTHLLTVPSDRLRPQQCPLLPSEFSADGSGALPLVSKCASSALDPHLVASHLELQSVLLEIFQERHRSSAKCLGSCCALRRAAIFPVTFRSATPSGVGACCSVRLPKKLCLDAC